MPKVSDDSAQLTEPVAQTAAPQVIYIRQPGRQSALWLIVVLLAVIATALLMRWDETAVLRSALAQTGAFSSSGLDGTRGIYAFTGQISARSYGLFMVDVDTGTVWCYEIERSGSSGEPRLRLIAARSWVFDRYLEEFNTVEPIPSAVREMVQQQRSNRSPVTRPSGGG